MIGFLLYGHKQPNVMVACARARHSLVVLFPKVGKCNQTTDTYTGTIIEYLAI
jgi:hypothetical protein